VLVLKLTTSASVTTGFESWSSRCCGDVCAKIATIGSSRNANATAAAATLAQMTAREAISS
jgi:uncharacterized protein CbrC (UPF0167 family)